MTGYMAAGLAGRNSISVESDSGMLLDPNAGSMSGPDLRDLIETRIPDHRRKLEECHENLGSVAAYCENTYAQARDKNVAFDHTKQYAIQSLASVAYQINTLARDLLDMLSLQTDKIGTLTSQMDSLNIVVKIHKEKAARREIGQLTASKSVPKQSKIIAPPAQDQAVSRYKRTMIDYSLLDGVGHGYRCEPSRAAPLVQRAPSSVSSAGQHYAHTQYGVPQYERTANIGNNTLSRNSMRSGNMSIPSEYRVPQVDHRFDSMTTMQLQSGQGSGGGSDYGSHNTPTSHSGSHYGSMEYGASGIGHQDRYGTLRAHPRPGFEVSDGRESPGLPPPPPNTAHYGELTLSRPVVLPPPSRQLLDSSHDDEPLPPPPPLQSTGSSGHPLPPLSTTGSYFESQDWVPRDGSFIEKAIVLYDYEADKADELSLRENAVVYVVRKNEDGWFEGVMDGVTGLFPGNYVRPLN